MVVFGLKCDVCGAPWSWFGDTNDEAEVRSTVKEARAEAAEKGWTFVRGWDLCRACAGKQPAEAKEA